MRPAYATAAGRFMPAHFFGSGGSPSTARAPNSRASSRTRRRILCGCAWETARVARGKSCCARSCGRGRRASLDGAPSGGRGRFTLTTRLAAPGDGGNTAAKLATIPRHGCGAAQAVTTNLHLPPVTAALAAAGSRLTFPVVVCRYNQRQETLCVPTAILRISWRRNARGVYHARLLDGLGPRRFRQTR